MKVSLSDKIVAWLTLLSGLTISAVAVWYSVAGLVSIFAAAVIPIIVMGVALEVSKLVATIWLKLNWHRAPGLIKIYLTTAIAILMLITSMGIFGFLSKAHSDQSLVSGDVQSKISIIDEKIATEKGNIEAARKALAQMDAAVDQTMARSTTEQGAGRAAQLRRQQAKERATLQADIVKAQKAIAALNEEAAPIRAEVRKIEAEVGPIKYIAAFVYGSNPDANLLEKAVTWVIIIIVAVFDPLAVILLLASQYSFQWFRQQREQIAEGDSPEKESNNIVDSTATVTEQPVRTEPTVTLPVEEPVKEVVINEETHPYLYKTGGGFTNLQPMVYKPEEPKVEEPKVEEAPDEDQGELDNASASEKVAMAKWKHDHPDSSLKLQRKLLEKGVISELPWMKYLKPKEDFVDEAAVEAAKWAQEQLEKTQTLDERPGDYIKPEDISYMENVDGQQVKKVVEGYQQNAEQNESTIWQRVKKAKGE